MTSKSALLLATALIAMTACNGSSSTNTTARSETTSPTSSTTTTSATATTLTPPTTTSIDVGESSNLHIAGSKLVYSPDGQVFIRGWVDRPSDVSVGGSVTPIDEDGVFETDLRLDPGRNAIEIKAVDDGGAEESETIEVLVDPELQLEFAWTVNVDPGKGEIVADYAEWLTGDEATRAAIEDGEQVDPEGLPGDFYIRNRNPLLRTLPLSPDVVIVLLAGGDENLFPPNTQVDVDTWSAFLADPENAPEDQGVFWYGTGNLPYWLTLDPAGQVIQVTEHYLP